VQKVGINNRDRLIRLRELGRNWKGVALALITPQPAERQR
jgi:hypothetical protein